MNKYNTFAFSNEAMIKINSTSVFHFTVIRSMLLVTSTKYVKILMRKKSNAKFVSFIYLYKFNMNIQMNNINEQDIKSAFL